MARPPHRVSIPEARQAIQNRVSSTANRARDIADKVSNTSLSDAKKYVETYAFGKNTVDTYLKTNVTLSRIQSNDTFENFAFYATYKRHDVNEYAGLFGKNLMNRANAAAKQAEKLAKKTGLDEDLQNAKELRDKADSMKIYQLKIGATKKLKIPSDENAGNVVGDLLKDADFRKNLSLSIDHSKEIMRRPTQQALFRDAQSILQKRGTLTNAEKQTLYKALNLSLTNHNDYGYGALVDINDKEYSSYHAHRPMIIFDTDSVKLQSSAQMKPKTIERLNAVYNTERILKDIPANVMGVPKKYGETTINIARRTVESAYNEYLGKGR
jgi:rRNA maturation endonuclease Nob1